MKIKNVRFLANANIKGNKKSSSVLISMVILVICLTLISSFSLAITNGVNEYKSDSSARTFTISPYYRPLDEEAINEVLEIEHVESVEMLQGMREEMFDVLTISDKNGTDEELQKQIDEKGGTVEAWSLNGSRKKSVVAGKTLDESPEFSCIVPDRFYPFDDEYEFAGDVDYLDGESLIGKTLTVKPTFDHYETFYNTDGVLHEILYLPALEYKLKIVGVYREIPTSDGYPNSVFVSEETGRLIEQMAFDASGVEYSPDNDIGKWLYDSSMRDYYVLVDDYDNLDYVMNKLTELNIFHDFDSEYHMKPAIFTISAIFSAASIFLTIAAVILSIINIMQSSVNSLLDRKGEIGLLKSIGYKDKQIFFTLYYEQIAVTLRAFLIGAGISAIITAVVNFINTYRSYDSRIYVVNWFDFLIFLAISLAIAIIVPTICQVITLKKLNKIQPKDAMNET